MEKFTKKIILFLTLTLGLIGGVGAQNFFCTSSATSGNWSAGASWSNTSTACSCGNAGGLVTPSTSAHTVTICQPRTVTTSTGATCGTLTINSGGSLTINSGITLSVGTLVINSGGTLTVNGTLNISGNFTNGGTFNASTGTVNFNGTTSVQSIPAATFYNLTLSGSVNKSMAGAVTVSNSLTFSTDCKLLINSHVLTLNGTGTGMTAGGSRCLSGSADAELVIGGSGAFGNIAMETTSSTTQTLKNLTINKSTSATFTNVVRVSTNLNLFNGAASFTNLIFSSGATVTRDRGSLNAVGTFGSQMNYVYGRGASTQALSITTGPELTTSTSAIQNFTVNTTGTVTATLNASTTINGICSITAGKLGIGSNTLTLNGTVANMSGSNCIVGSANSNLTIGGTGTLGTLFFDQSLSSTNNIKTYTQNRTSTGIVNLGNDMSIVTSFAFGSTGGLFILGSGADLNIKNGATITGTPSATKMIVTSAASGYLTYTFGTTNNQTFTYPIGDNAGADFNSFLFTLATNNVSDRVIGFKVVDDCPPAFGSSTNYISRYYMTYDGSSGSGAGNYTYSANLPYIQDNSGSTCIDKDIVGTEGNIQVQVGNGATYTPVGSTLVNSGSDNMPITGSETNYPLGGTNNYIIGLTAPACVAPTSQVTGFTTGVPTVNSVPTISFNAPSGGADGYLLTTNPDGLYCSSACAVGLDGNTFVVGDIFGDPGFEQTVRYSGTATSGITATGLASNTNYSFFIYPYNNTNCSGGPNYRELQTAPLATKLTKPGLPQSLTSSGSGCNSEIISFTAPTGNGTITSYTLQYKASSSGTWLTASSSITSSPYTLNGLAANTTYDIQLLATNATGSGDYLTVTSAFNTNCIPNNNECVNSANAPSGGTDGTTFNATSSGVNDYNNWDDDDVWYTFTAPTGGNAIITLFSYANPSPSTNVILDLRDNSACPATRIQARDFVSNGGSSEVMRVSGLTQGDVYRMRVFSKGTTNVLNAGFNIKVQTGYTPASNPGDNVCDAELYNVALGSPKTGQTNTNYGFEVGEPTGTNWGFDYSTRPSVPSRSQWFYYTPSVSGSYTFTGSVIANSTGIQMGIYTSTSVTPTCSDILNPALRTEVGSSYNNTLNGSAVVSSVCLVAGKTYYIQLDEYLGGLQTPTLTITLNSTIAAPTANAVSTFNCSSFTASWNTVSGAASYEIDVANDAGFTSLVGTYNSLNVGNVTSYNVNTGLLASQTYYYRVRAISSTCSAVSANSNSQSVTLTACVGGPLTWTGASSTDWNTPGNWTPAGPPTANDDILIPNQTNDPVLTTGANGVCKTVTISSGATVTINTGKTIDVKGNWVGANNTVSGPGDLIFSGTTAQTISGGAVISNLQINNTSGVTAAAGVNTVNVTTALELKEGVFTTNGNVIIVSNPGLPLTAVQAYINDFTTGMNGSLSGTVRVERYITAGPNGFRYIGAPVNRNDLTNNTFPVSSLTGFVLSGTPGQLIPTPDCSPLNSAQNSPYGNFMYWVENSNYGSPICRQRGWWFQTSGNMQLGRGYGAKLGSGNKLTYTGFANTGSVTHNCTHTVVFSNLQNGWNLVSNPFPSAITINTTTADAGNPNNDMPAGFDGEIKFYENNGPFTGTYQAQNSGIAPVTIALGQGFWARVTNPGTANWTLTDGHRVEGSAYYYSTNAVEDHLNITVSGNDFMDQTDINFMPEATPGFDFYDASKWLSANGQPTLYTLIGQDLISINSNPLLVNTVAIPMGLVPGADGVFTLNFNDIASFPQSAMMVLEDLQLDSLVDLRQFNSYTFTMLETDSANRFIIHFQPGVTATVADQDCDNATGSITYTQNGTTVWSSYNVKDNSNNTYAQGTNYTGTLTVNNLAPQEYILNLTHASGYSTQEFFTVNSQGVPVVVSLAASDTTISMGGMVTLTATTANATGYAWNFGDGSNTTGGTSQQHTYVLPGIYTAVITANNDSCSKADAVTIYVADTTTGINNNAVSNLSIFGQGDRVVVQFNNWGGNKADIFMYNSLGQRVESLTGVSTVKGRQELNVAGIKPGYYFIQVVSNNKVEGRKIYLGTN